MSTCPDTTCKLLFCKSGIGGFKIPRFHKRGGSSPPSGTIYNEALIFQGYFVFISALQAAGSEWVTMDIEILEGKLKLYTWEIYGGNIQQNLLIAAHGAVWRSRSFMGVARSIAKVHCFKIPPWATLYFYAPHGTATSTGLEPYMKWKYPPLEAVMPGETVINYDLGHVESGLPFTTDQRVNNHLITNRCHSAGRSIDHPFRFLDIATTEPSGPANTTLKEVLTVLFRTGRIYPRIHCTFCRQEYGRPKNEYTPGYDNIIPSS